MFSERSIHLGAFFGAHLLGKWAICLLALPLMDVIFNSF